MSRSRVKSHKWILLKLYTQVLGINISTISTNRPTRSGNLLVTLLELVNREIFIQIILLNMLSKTTCIQRLLVILRKLKKNITFF